MYEITKVEHLVDKDWLMVIKAPFVAKKCEPGQFMIAKLGELGERIPFTIADYDREAETITIVFQVVGASTEKMSHLKAGDSFTDIVGPLGRPSEMIDTPIEELKKEGMWFVCADMDGELMYKLNLKGSIGLVIGNEGEGVSRLVKEKCDMVASIPMKGDIDSLNASVACGVLAYEIVRQRLN